MTHTSVRWVNVLFGVGLTLTVAVAPMLFIMVSGVSAQDRQPGASADSESAPLLSGGLALPEHQAMLVLMAVVAVVALLVTIVLSMRSERVR